MARKSRAGLDYFPLDTTFLTDRKMRRLCRKHGTDAASAILSLFCEIYGDAGYYLVWNDDICFDLSETAGVSPETMHQIVTEALQVGIFDTEQFHINGILTSHGIQAQYIACKTKKRASIDERFSLVSADETEDIIAENEGKTPENTDKIPENVDKTPKKRAKSTQRKEKESKVEENQRKENLPPTPSVKTAGEEAAEGEEMEEVLGFSVPVRCLNRLTHNTDGLLERLGSLRVHDPDDVRAILRLSDYGRLHEYVWKIIAHGNWPRGRIEYPGKFIISQIRKKGGRG